MCEYEFLNNPPNPANHCIRLLELKPGVKGDPICITIYKTVLEECEPYEALSYCWGDARSMVRIAIEDKDFMVTSKFVNRLNISQT
jgi:hypothetical protein